MQDSSYRGSYYQIKRRLPLVRRAGMLLGGSLPGVRRTPLSDPSLRRDSRWLSDRRAWRFSLGNQLVAQILDGAGLARGSGPRPQPSCSSESMTDLVAGVPAKLIIPWRSRVALWASLGLAAR